MENLSGTSHLSRKSATPLPQFKWYLGKSTRHVTPPVQKEQSKVNPRDLVRSTEKRVQELGTVG